MRRSRLRLLIQCFLRHRIYTLVYMIQDDIINHVEYFQVTIYTVTGQRKENKTVTVRILCIHNNYSFNVACKIR